jgi:hypothetical protein
MNAAFAKLTESAQNINEISNELAKPVASLQNALKSLNVGVACWTTIDGGEEFSDYWSRDVGIHASKESGASRSAT